MKLCTGLIPAAVTLAVAGPALAGETIRIAIGTQDATINTAHGGLLVRELRLLEKHLPRTGRYAGVEYEVVWKNFTSGPPLDGEMLAGKLDMGALGDFPAVLNGLSFARRGKRSLFIAALSGSALGAGNGLVVPAESPVQRLADLKGKRISVPFGSAAHGMLLRAIAELGWDPERDVSLVSQSPQVGGSALRSGKIDAHANFVPFAELFPFLGYARKVYDGSMVNVPTCHGLVARGEFADRYPELVVAYLQAVLEADRLLASDPERYAQLISQVSGVRAEVVYMFHGPLGIQTRDLTLKPEVRRSLQVALESLTLLHRAEARLDLARFVDDRFLRRAAQQSGIDYQARLERSAPAPLAGQDARTGLAIDDPRMAAELWIEGEQKVRRYASVASAFAALGELADRGQKVRIALVHDRQTGIKLLAEKVWYVVNEGAPDTTIAAFLTRQAAERWARDEGGKVADFPGAKRSVASAALPGAQGIGAHARLR
jgi:NitT/TauT family transport system substrate-binding protein